MLGRKIWIEREIGEKERGKKERIRRESGSNVSQVYP